jgi:hypothetical protein
MSEMETHTEVDWDSYVDQSACARNSAANLILAFARMFKRHPFHASRFETLVAPFMPQASITNLSQIASQMEFIDSATLMALLRVDDICRKVGTHDKPVTFYGCVSVLKMIPMAVKIGINLADPRKTFEALVEKLCTQIDAISKN